MHPQPSSGSITQYLSLLIAGNSEAVLDLFRGEPHIDDPFGGHVLGQRDVHRFVDERHRWLSERGARLEPIRTTQVRELTDVASIPYECIPPIAVQEKDQPLGRTVVEVMVHLSVDGRPIALPVAVVGEVDDAQKVYGLRVYHSFWPLLGTHRVRPAVLSADRAARLSGVMERYQQALVAADLDGVLATFEPDGCVREPSGGEYIHCGEAGLRGFYQALFTPGGVPLEHCTVTDDGVCTALEYNARHWGPMTIPRQPGVAVYERSMRSGLLQMARLYDDIAVEKGVGE